MFTIRIETGFQASHQLTLPDGTKEALHGHNWSVAVEAGSSRLNSMGLVMDFHRLKAMTDGIVADFNNICLEGIDHFRRNNSSAENVAKYIYEKLKPGLPRGVSLNYVEVMEEPGCFAKFSGQQDCSGERF